MKLRLFSACLAGMLLGTAAVMVSGCSVAQRVQGQFSEFFQSVDADGDEPVVYAAARSCLEGMGYTYQRGSLSSHRLEMATAIQPGGDAQNLRQRRAILEFRAAGSQGTQIKIGFWETSEETNQRESSFVGSRLIRGGALYEAFFDRLAKALPDRPIPGDASSAPAAAP